MPNDDEKTAQKIVWWLLPGVTGVALVLIVAIGTVMWNKITRIEAIIAERGERITRIEGSIAVLDLRATQVERSLVETASQHTQIMGLLADWNRDVRGYPPNIKRKVEKHE